MRKKQLLKQAHLQTILDALRTSDCTPRALRYFKPLQIVQTKMNALKHIMVDDRALLEYAVYSILSDIIEMELLKQRTILNLSYHPLQKLVSRKQAIREIEKDNLTRSIPLIGWSFLYHNYIRTDLNITNQKFAEIIHVNPRTLRRYKNQATSVLLRHLIHTETQTIE